MPARRKVTRSNLPRGIVSILCGMSQFLRGKVAWIGGINANKWGPGGKRGVCRGMRGDTRGMAPDIGGMISNVRGKG